MLIEASKLVQIPVVYVNWTGFWRLMESQNISIEELKISTGLSARVVERIRTGGNLQNGHFLKICQFFGCQPGDVLSVGYAPMEPYKVPNVTTCNKDFQPHEYTGHFRYKLDPVERYRELGHKGYELTTYGVISKSTLDRIRHSEAITPQTVVEVCNILKVPVNEFMEFVPT